MLRSAPDRDLSALSMAFPIPAPTSAVGLLFLLACPPLSGQTTLTGSVGPNEWDLSGTGSGWSAGLAVERPLAGVISVEGRLGYFAASDADDDPVRALLPELGVVLTTPTAVVVRLVVGGGWSLGLGGWPEDDPTLFAAAGIGFGVGAGWTLRPELRIRAVDPWVGTIAELNLGLAHGFVR
jgi:hypothetical protein